MFFQNVLLNKLNIIIFFQYFFKTLINVYKYRLLNEFSFADNQNKTLVVIRKINYYYFKRNVKDLLKKST